MEPDYIIKWGSKMQVCVVYGGKTSDATKLKAIADAISNGLESQGNIKADVFNMAVDTAKRLTIYDYMVVVSEPISFFSGKVPAFISKYLENAGTVSGKRAACVISGGARSSKALLNLMKITEGQGIILKTSEVVKNADEAKAFGSHLNVERNF